MGDLELYSRYPADLVAFIRDVGTPLYTEVTTWLAQLSPGDRLQLRNDLMDGVFTASQYIVDTAASQASRLARETNNLYENVQTGLTGLRRSHDDAFGRHDWDLNRGRDIGLLTNGEPTHERNIRQRTQSYDTSETCLSSPVVSPPDISLSNTPATTQAMGDNQAGIGGAEPTIDPIKHVWKKFPNSQTCNLKFVRTMILGDVVGGALLNVNQTQQYRQGDGDNAQFTTINTTAGGTSTSTNLGFTSMTIGPNQFDGAATISNLRGHDFNFPYLMQIRMNTPYNIIKRIDGKSTLGTNSPLDVGTTAAGNISGSQPGWIEFFDHKYQYYTQLEVDYTVKLQFGFPMLTTSNSTDYASGQGILTMLHIFWKYTNDDDPPVQQSITTANFAAVATSLTGNSNNYPLSSGDTTFATTAAVQPVDGGTTAPLAVDDYLRMESFHHKIVYFSNTENIMHTTISGKYKTGQCKMDLQVNSNNVHSTGAGTETETWFQTQSTPTWNENLSIIVVQDDMTGSGGAVQYIPFSARIETNHLIQFKDLRQVFKFPTLSLTAVTPASDSAFFQRSLGNM